MLTDDLLKERYASHLDRLIELAEQELERTRPEPHYHRLAGMYSGSLPVDLATRGAPTMETWSARSGASRRQAGWK